MKDETILSLIKPPDIGTQNYEEALRAKIIKRLRDCGLDKGTMKFEPRIVRFVCVAVETLVSKQQRLDKRGIVCDIWREVFGLSLDDETHLKTIVDTLHLMGKLKKKSVYHLFVAGVADMLHFR